MMPVLLSTFDNACVSRDPQSSIRSQGTNLLSQWSRTTQNLEKSNLFRAFVSPKYSAELGFRSISGMSQSWASGTYSALGADHVDDDQVGNRLHVAGGRQNAMSSKPRHSKSH